MTYEAIRCNCGDTGCTDWHITDVADVLGVKFDEIQARTVAVILNQLAEQQTMWLAQLTAETVDEAIAVMPQAEPDDEMRVVRKLVEDIIAAGYAINVIDDTEGDGEKVVNLGRNVESILGALRSTHGDVLQISEQRKTFAGGWSRCGDITLIYGNAPWEVISDHSDNEIMDRLLAGANALCVELEAAAS